MREFAEDEIRIPSGQYEGRRFKCSRQPFAGLWFDAVADQHWYECVITGPSQSGKTLIGFVIPCLYHLFELRQDVIGAVPDYDIVSDKWFEDLLPAIERTRYRDQLPHPMPRTRQAKISFRSGVTLRWMTAGGGDKSRAAFTAPTVCMTETDGFDTRTSTSDEANKIEQIEARMRSYPLEQRRIYKEGTLTVEDGHTWHRYTSGSHGRIAIQCQHCRHYVTPERQDFLGWQVAKTDAEAARDAHFRCPVCYEPWTEQQRRQANDRGVLLHKGQDCDQEGDVSGEIPDTRTLGFRWSAAHNLLVPAADVGLDEWRAARAIDEDDEQRKLCQFVWAIPYVPSDREEIELRVEDVTDQQTSLGRGVCPDDTQWVTVGVDVNKPVLHWTAIAWVVRDAYIRGHIIDFGRQGVKQDKDWQDEFFDAVVKLDQNLGAGWSNLPKSKTAFSRAVVDARWQTPLVIKGIKRLKTKRWRPFQGKGSAHWKKERYSRPKRVGGSVTWVGSGCHEEYVGSHKCRVTIADANWWKTWLHSRLILHPEDSSEEPPNGALTIFESADEQGDLVQFARHLTAEKEQVDFERGKGSVKKWVAIRSANHWLDSTYMACVAGNWYWDKLIGKPRSRRRPAAVAGHKSSKGNTSGGSRYAGRPSGI